MSSRLLLFYIFAWFSYGCSVTDVSQVQTQQYIMSDSLFATIDSGIYKLSDPYRQQLSKQMLEVLCTSSVAMERGNPEGLLGNFVSDVSLSEGNLEIASRFSIEQADFIILNNGGLRKPLPKGPIALGDIYEVMPFENQLVVLECPARLVQQLADFIASKGGTPVSGIRFQLDKKSGRATGIHINGSALDTLKTYRVMTADYLANGGDQFDLFKEANKRTELGLKIRDALINYARKAGNREELLQPKLDGRISYVVE